MAAATAERTIGSYVIGPTLGSGLQGKCVAWRHAGNDCVLPADVPRM